MIELFWCKLKRYTHGRTAGASTWAGLLEAMWRAFGEPDSLQHPDAEKAYLHDESYAGELNDLFRQRASRKVREFFRLYHENADASPEDIHEKLRPLMKSKRQHRTPPVAGVHEMG